MNKVHLLGIGLFVLFVAAVTGCNRQDGKPGKGANKGAMKSDEDHDHGPGPHGGTIVEFGKWHGEFTVNHKAREATFYILGADAKTAHPLKVEKLLLSIKTPQFQVDLKAVPQQGDPAGLSSRFVGNHEHFGKEQEFESTVSGVVDGKPYAGDFKEQSEAPKKDKK